MITLLKKRPLMFLFIILAIGSFLRFYGLNWDQGHHLHPDERAIVMFTTPVSFPNSIEEFLSPTSPLNPHFFAYGSFPLYLLKISGLIATDFDPAFALYDKINLVGRFLSALFDIGTLFLVFLLGKKLFSKSVGFIAAFFYSISVLPIQASHFYAVDIMLTFFIVLALFQLIRFYERPSIKNSILVGVCFGAALATKISTTPLVIAILLAITVDFILLFIKQPHKPHVWFPHIPRFLKRLFFDGIIISVATIVTFIILQPYAIIDFQEFLRQTQQVSQVTNNAFAFPFTLQYVGKTPYLYELKNIFLWGQGPILAILSFLGAIYISFRVIKKHLGWWRSQVPSGTWRGSDLDSSEVDVHLRGVHSATSKVQIAQELILVIFFWVYFLIVGNFAIGFMRYLLPLYPLLAIFAAISFLRILKFLPSNFRKLFAICYLLFAILWPLSFMHIYTKPNTRVLASQWIYQNIPPNKTIAREHWDDGMPIGGNIFYKTLELPIYEMENPLREAQIYQMVQQSDYIIIASNRLYVPLQKLAKNCQKWNLPPERCSHNASRYYKKLFSGELGYQKVAEFSVYPKLEVSSLKLEVDDSSSDESFTVYDHPKVMIFKKILF